MSGRAAAVLVLIAATAAADPAPGWEVRIPDKLEIGVGSSGTLPIAISVDHGLAVSRDAAVIVDLDPSAAVGSGSGSGSGSGGLTIKRRRLGRADAVDPEADEPRFAVPVRADAAGERAVSVRVRFWLCGSRVCRPIDVARTVSVSVAPPPEP